MFSQLRSVQSRCSVTHETDLAVDVVLPQELCTGGTLLELIEEREQLSEVEAGKIDKRYGKAK